MAGQAGSVVRTKVRVAIEELRAIVNGDAHPDEPTLRRILLRATAGIADPAKAADLHQDLSDAILAVDAARSVGSGPEEIALWASKAAGVIEQVEMTSLSH